MAFEERYLMRRGQTAFSLVELAVVLVILGILLGVGITAGQGAIKNAERLSTLERMALIKQALDAYAQRNGYLPCPADPSQLPSGSGFGVESRNATAGLGCWAIPGHVFQTSNVWFGTLPVRNLGLDDSFMQDAWGSKLTYAVSGLHVGTTGAANSWNSYANQNGPISMRNGTIASSRVITSDVLGAPNPGATYVVVSHGQNKRGAYPFNGTGIALACSGGASEIDIGNCDRTDATFMDAPFNEGEQASLKFDDYIVWGTNNAARNPATVLPNACPTISGNPTCESWCAPCEITNTSLAPGVGTRMCAKFITAPLPTCTARCIWPSATMPCP